MSGHSKWHNIQARKGKQDAIKGNVFSKYAKQIMVCAKMGGGDPVMNFSLRILVEKAKASGMPKDNIERAIKRGTGEAEGVQVEEAIYEAYGPGGVAILIKTITDNKNRTISEIKHLLSESGGSLGGAGGVMWMFEKCGLIVISSEVLASNKINREELEMKMIEIGTEDIWEEDGMVYFKIKLDGLKHALDLVKELNLETERSGVEYIAKDKVKVDSNIEERLKRLFGALGENDDVEDYYTNAG